MSSKFSCPSQQMFNLQLEQQREIHKLQKLHQEQRETQQKFTLQLEQQREIHKLQKLQQEQKEIMYKIQLQQQHQQFLMQLEMLWARNENQQDSCSSCSSSNGCHSPKV